MSAACAGRRKSDVRAAVVAAEIRAVVGGVLGVVLILIGVLLGVLLALRIVAIIIVDDGLPAAAQTGEALIYAGDASADAERIIAAAEQALD